MTDEQRRNSLRWILSQTQELERRTAEVMALLDVANSGDELDLLDFELKRADLAALVDTMNREARALAYR